MNHQTLVDQQTAYFNTNVTKPLAFRQAQLLKLKAALQAHESELYVAIKADFGKSEFEGYVGELALIYQDIDEAVKLLKKWIKPQKVPTNLANLPAKCAIYPEPLGVALIMGAWNYPIQLVFGPAVAAMAAGCTVVMKPSELTAHSAAVVKKIVASVFENQYFAVVEGGVPETTELLKCRFDKIFFTGSGNVGRIVYQAAAKHLTPVTLELGGKSPTFVTASADLAMTAKRLCWAKFLNAGQTCIAPDYILVEESVKSAFIAAMQAQIKTNDYQLANDNYVQIVNDRNVERLKKLIDAHQDKIVMGGQVDVATRVIQPTLIDGVTASDAIMQEEIFGPLLPIMTYTDLNEAIAYVKKQDKPLALYLFTKDDAIKEKIVHELSFGGGCINDAIMHITNGHMPFGGVGGSGLGSYHGYHGFRAFSHFKSMMEKSFFMELAIKHTPYSATKLKWLKRML